MYIYIYIYTYILSIPRAPSFVDTARCKRADLSCFFKPLAPACDPTPRFNPALHVDVRN